MSGLRLDLGCGSDKKEGTIGLDVVPGPAVDHVLNLETDRLPFPDGSVESVFSSHCLEHLSNPLQLFSELSRVCQEGARLEFWTPYAWENSAFVLGHQTYYNEDHYLHPCLWFVDYWKPILGKRWALCEIVYIIDPPILADLFRERIDLEFALRYYKGVAREFGVLIDVWRDFPGPEVRPQRRFALNRDGPRHNLLPVAYPPPEIAPEELDRAIVWFGKSYARQLPVAPSPGMPLSDPRRLGLMRHLAQRVALVFRQQGLVAVARKTTDYLGRRIRTATSPGPR